MPGSGPTGEDASTRALEQFQNLIIPTLGEQEISSLQNEYLGDFTPEMMAAIGMDPSAMEGISLDPRLQAAQMEALDQISQMGETGLLPGEKAALNQARRAAAGEAQAKSAQLLDEFTRRGMGGSGAELASRLQAGQSSADRLGQESDRLAQMAQERALSAITQKGNLAGSIRGQEFGEQSDIAKAQDAINQFNTANRQQVQATNVGATNQAGMRNLSEKQRIAENNIALKNREQEYNKGLIQQKFQNEIQKAGGTAQQYNQIAAAQQQDAANQGNMMGNIIDAGTRIGAAYMTAGGSEALRAAQQKNQTGGPTSDKKAKKNIKEVSMSDFLDDLVPYKYDYKQPEKHGQGKQAGVMADDIEKEMPQLVGKDEEGLKYIDSNKSIGPIFASLAELHERLKKLEG
jgi:hypothetical protein